MSEKKIVVVAGNRQQFQRWLRHNVVPITCREDMTRLRGIEVGEVYYEGTYYEWAEGSVNAELEHLINR